MHCNEHLGLRPTWRSERSYHLAIRSTRSLWTVTARRWLRFGGMLVIGDAGAVIDSAEMPAPSARD